MLYILNPQSSRVFNSKLKGVVEYLENFENVTCIDYNETLQDIENFPGIRSGNSILIDPRSNIGSRIKGIIKKYSLKIYLTANHFMVPNKSLLEFFLSYNGKKIILLESAASKEDVSNIYNQKNDCDFLIIAPVIDSEKDKLRFKFYENVERKKSKILLAGAIYIHKKNSNIWWQRKYNINDYYPLRKFFYDLSSELEITNCSGILEPDFGCHSKIIIALIKKTNQLLGFEKRRLLKYYQYNIVEEFKRHYFFIAPADIFNVVPQFAFQAMRSGCILVGPKCKAYKSFGFVDGENYIGFDPNLTKDDASYLCKKIRMLSLSKILKMQQASISLLNDIFDKTFINLNSIIK